MPACPYVRMPVSTQAHVSTWPLADAQVRCEIIRPPSMYTTAGQAGIDAARAMAVERAERRAAVYEAAEALEWRPFAPRAPQGAQSLDASSLRAALAGLRPLAEVPYHLLLPSIVNPSFLRPAHLWSWNAYP